MCVCVCVFVCVNFRARAWNTVRMWGKFRVCLELRFRFRFRFV